MRAESSAAARDTAGGGGSSCGASATDSVPSPSAVMSASSNSCRDDRSYTATAQATSCARVSGTDRRCSPGAVVVTRWIAVHSPSSSSAPEIASAHASARADCSRRTRSSWAAASVCSARRRSRSAARRRSATRSLTSQPPPRAFTSHPAGLRSVCAVTASSTSRKRSRGCSSSSRSATAVATPR